jgi:hypothetical protein
VRVFIPAVLGEAQRRAYDPRRHVSACRALRLPDDLIFDLECI